MATIVGEALIAASLELLLEKIVSGEFVDFFRSTKLDIALLEKLKITLLSLQAVLHDAEEKQITNPAVKQWLVMVQDAVFEADSLFDKINTEALRCKVEAEYEGKTLNAKVNNIFSSRFKRFNRKINTKMQTLFERLDCLRKQKLGLKGVSSDVFHGTPTYSFVGDESSVCGRDEDRKKLKDLLLLENGNDGGSKIGVISIVGMGGLGKTTLAKLLYNDPEVKEKFELRGWAYISKDFDVFNITKTLFDSVTSKTINSDDPKTLHLESAVNSKRNDKCDLNTLQLQLQQILSNKTFLLVLDDIWYGRYVGWNNLNDTFNVRGMGSKIIITTRDERVALPLQNFFSVHHLKPLESEDCWSLLARHAFVSSNYQERSNLELIGKEISTKCKGLPLAAIALGGLLRIKLSQDYWNDVLQSSIWELTDDEVQPALLLSYRYLPSPLKGCFAYCSIFPKSSLLEKEMVVQLWIAEGLVVHPKSEKRWEKVAEEYFDELVSRSLIHRRHVDGEECFEMHDLINDLATMISSPSCIRMDEFNSQVSLERVRHLSYNRGQYDSYHKFVKLYGLASLRTFLPLPLQDRRPTCFLSSTVVHNLLPTTKQLRVLSLSDYVFTELPNSIGNLIYLRYLNLSGTNIEQLPSVTCKLYNLQTLLLTRCYSLAKLPKDIGKLVNLRHLDIRRTRLTEIPVQIVKLENLQTLSDFLVSYQCNGLKIADLGKFHHLQGKLSISQLQNVNNPSDAFHAHLEMKKHIDELVLDWGLYDTTSNSKVLSDILEQLRPSTNLKNLCIYGYRGNNFPNWLGDSLFSNMVYLKISNCCYCSCLPPLGQLGSLKEIFISNMEAITRVGIEFYGSSDSPSFQPFPSLEKLTFCGMPEWKEWKQIDGKSTEFPSLKCLSLEKCPKLGNIPRNISSLTILEFKGCPLLVESGDSDDNSNFMRPSSDVVFKQLMLPPLSSLQKLDIDNSPSLTSFQRDSLPKTLKSLKISNCRNLVFLPHEYLCDYTSLEELEISSSCWSMTIFTLGSLPVLKTMRIIDCINLKSILIAEGVSNQSLSFLRSITIEFCDELESLSMGGLPSPNLIYLKLQDCAKLCSLPEPINTMAGLKEMHIEILPDLQSIAKDYLPTSLQKLTIGSIGGMLGNTLWERLNCLSVMRICSGDIVEALMKRDVPLLPASLVSLSIYDVVDIECLEGKWLQHLTSLQKLELMLCDKLKSLPKEGLPPSLKVLCITDCPLLEASLKRKRGKEWRKISHIPSIIIYDELIT